MELNMLRLLQEPMGSCSFRARSARGEEMDEKHDASQKREEGVRVARCVGTRASGQRDVLTGDAPGVRVDTRYTVRAGQSPTGA